MDSCEKFKNHPLSRAKWLWPGGYVYLQNCHAQFRCDFSLETIPETAPFYITADQSYRLYINGRYVCRGPARGFQDHWPYDEVEIAAFLKTGHNFIAVEAYNPGIGTFQYLHRDTAGFICAAEWGNLRFYSDRKSWRMRRAPGNNANTARLSVQMGYQEDFNASKDDLSWIYSAEPPAWSADPVYSVFDAEVAFGKQPWGTVEERGIPMLREKRAVPAKLSAHGIGFMEPGYRESCNSSWHWNGAENRSVRDWHLPLDAEKTAENLQFTVMPVNLGQFRAVTVDLGAILCGVPALELEGCCGREIVDCHYHQWLKDGIPSHLIPAGKGGLLALAVRLRARKNYSRRTFYQMAGARYITLVFRELTQPVTVRFSWMTAEYPLAMRGFFHTSDTQLNRIYNLCRHTQRICATDAYIDTPWREQGQWWADARIQARNTFFLDGDTRLLARGIRSIAGQQTVNGLLYGVAPCCSPNCVLPDFSLTWVLTIYDHYFQTASLELFHEFKKRIERLFAYFESDAARAENGLLKHDPGLWLFEDWAALPKTGYPAFLNLWYLYAWEHYGKLLRAAGMVEESAAADRKSRFLRELLCNAFFDESTKLFLPGRALNGAPTGIPSVHDQVLAVLLGLKPEYHEIMAQKRIVPFLKGETLDCAVPSAFWCSYLFDAAQRLGHRREALEFIRREWSRMLPYGGTWEHLAFNEDEGFSCSHGWSAHPSFHLTELLCGLRQTAPGWKEFKFDPAFELLPDQGSIMVPLPTGDLYMSWQNGRFETELKPHCLPSESEKHYAEATGSGSCSGLILRKKHSIETTSSYPQ